MSNKFNTLGILTIGICLLTLASAHAVDVLRPEDEEFIMGVKHTNRIEPNQKDKQKRRVMVLPVSGNYAYSKDAPRRIEGFDPTTLPSNQPVEITSEQVNEIREMIDDCVLTRKDRMDLEREMFEEDKTSRSAAFLSQTLADINLCYEDIGYDIIETFYNRDINTIAEFSQKAKTFYVKGTDATFSPEFCGDTCSIEAIVEAQISKFAEFRAYLNKLLDERPINE